jgi:hypothetical protein
VWLTRLLTLRKEAEFPTVSLHLVCFFILFLFLCNSRIHFRTSIRWRRVSADELLVLIKLLTLKQKQTLVRSIWCSHSGGYEEFHLLGYKGIISQTKELFKTTVVRTSILHSVNLWGGYSSLYSKIRENIYREDQTLMYPILPPEMQGPKNQSTIRTSSTTFFWTTRRFIPEDRSYYALVKWFILLKVTFLI